MTLFRKFDTKNDFDNEDDDDHSPRKQHLNELTSPHASKSEDYFDFDASKSKKQTLDTDQLEAAKRRQMKINKCHKILREILFSCIFLSVLFVVAYSGRDQNSFRFQKHIAKSFIGYKYVKIMH